jgi:hypothetical protein
MFDARRGTFGKRTRHGRRRIPHREGVAFIGTCGVDERKRVAVEKGTKEVISANSNVYGERTFNKLQRNFDVETPPKEFFNTHACLRH